MTEELYKCYVCHEAQPSPGKYVAEFEDKRWRVCEDCALGIRAGLEILGKLEVTKQDATHEK